MGQLEQKIGKLPFLLIGISHNLTNQLLLFDDFKKSAVKAQAADSKSDAWDFNFIQMTHESIIYIYLHIRTPVIH